MYDSAALFFILAIVFAVASGRPLSSDHHNVLYRMHHRSINVPTVPQRRCNAPRSATNKTATGNDANILKATPSLASLTLAQPTASSTTSTQAGPAPTGILGDLFPAGNAVASWTTSTQSGSALPLSDATFKPHNVLSALTHTYVTAPDGEKSIQAIYPEGSYTFTHGNTLGGFSFYAPGPSNVDLTLAKEATFGYSTFFPDGFEFQKGGKLPGLYGGDSDADSIGCSGGSRSTKCFSARLMWRTDGAGELYLYMPPSDIPQFSSNKAVCNIKPVSECNPTYGASVGRGAFSFAAGTRTYVSQRVRLNDVGKANGEIELFANGRSVISASGLILRDNENGRIRGLQMQTFFGGSTPDFASPQTQSAYFSDMSVAITELL